MVLKSYDLVFRAYFNDGSRAWGSFAEIKHLSTLALGALIIVNVHPSPQGLPLVFESYDHSFTPRVIIIPNSNSNFNSVGNFKVENCFFNQYKSG